MLAHAGVAVGLLAAGAVPAAAEPAVRIPESVDLAAHAHVRMPVTCVQTRLACRGVLVLGQTQLCSSVPVGDPSCQVVLGQQRFAIPAGKRRIVTVRRLTGPQAISTSSDFIEVVATAYSRRHRRYPVNKRSRRLRLVAPLVLRRPDVAPTVTALQRLEVKEQGVRALAHLPLMSTSARVRVASADADVTLHRDRFTPFVTGRRSFAVGGSRWHGQAPTSRDEPAVGTIAAVRLESCQSKGCSTVDETIRVASDPATGPICVLHPLP